MIVVAPGSVSRTLPIPGLAERGIGFKTIGEAIYLRNHVLDRLDIAASATDAGHRRRALTFVFVGGGYAGIEALAELEDMARYATRYYDTISPDDMRWVLVEATERILPEVSVPMAAYTVQQLLKRGIDVRLDTRLESLRGGHVVLSDGEEFDAETIVWTAGVKPNPMLGRTDLPLDEKGRLRCTPDLRVDRGRGRLERRRLRRGARPDRRPGRVHRPVAPSTPSGRPRRWPTTSSPRCAAGSWPTTGTSTSARSPASACTRASPRCTASSSAACWPGSCTGRTT